MKSSSKIQKTLSNTSADTAASVNRQTVRLSSEVKIATDSHYRVNSSTEHCGTDFVNTDDYQKESSKYDSDIVWLFTLKLPHIRGWYDVRHDGC